MEARLRTTRTLKVTEVQVTPEETAQLVQLLVDPRYIALLNVMERACIEIDTAHLNTPVSDPEAVLGGHCLSKGVWLFFTYIQKQVLNASYTGLKEDNGKQSPASLEEVIQGVE
jgi:hypothetical protein